MEYENGKVIVFCFQIDVRHPGNIVCRSIFHKVVHCLILSSDIQLSGKSSNMLCCPSDIPIAHLFYAYDRHIARATQPIAQFSREVCIA